MAIKKIYKQNPPLDGSGRRDNSKMTIVQVFFIGTLYGKFKTTIKVESIKEKPIPSSENGP